MGEGLMLKYQGFSVKESKMVYYISGNRYSRAIAAILPLISDCRTRLKKRDPKHQGAIDWTRKFGGSFKKQKDATNHPSKKSP